ncbi:hypothetical protein [Streptomyces chrestomyceticus]|uniref:hypothetical protein n=1 Tax=Streptomyces chrestomyceticus TaxID=68185 RepID=UPI0035A95D5C
MSGALTSPRAAEPGIPPPRFTARPAERADETSMKALVDAGRVQQCPSGTAAPHSDVPALALLGEVDDYGHPQAWVLVEGAHLRACFTMQVIPPVVEGQPMVWVSSVCLDPQEPRAHLCGEVPGPALPVAGEAAPDGASQAAVVLMYWLMHYTHQARAVRRIHLTSEDSSVDLHPTPFTWLPAVVETQVPGPHHLSTCLARHNVFRTPTELPRAD